MSEKACTLFYLTEAGAGDWFAVNLTITPSLSLFFPPPLTL